MLSLTPLDTLILIQQSEMYFTWSTLIPCYILTQISFGHIYDVVLTFRCFYVTMITMIKAQ